MDESHCDEEHWILCPRCQSKTRTKILSDTVLIRFPLFCPKCKAEFLINLRRLHMTILQRPDAKTQSR